MKKVLVVIGIIIATVIILIGILYLFVLSGAIFMFNSNPPAPEVTYGEFPFRLVYEIDGETKVIEDTIICEFDGFVNHGSAGNYRKWKSYVKTTGKSEVTLYDLRSNGEFTEWGNQVLELCFDPGSGEYYMGDSSGRQSRGSLGQWVDYLYLTPEGKMGYSAFELNEAWEKYKIRFVSWECAPPIENSFK